MAVPQTADDRLYLGLRQHHRQTLWRLRLRHVIQPRQIDSQYFFIKEQERTFRLILRTGRNITLDRQMR